MKHFCSCLTMALLCLALSPCVRAQVLDSIYAPLEWRNVGPTRGGRSVASVGVPGDPLTYYTGTTGGGVWKTEDAGQHWNNISDGYFKTGSVGAIAVAQNDPNVIYVGMGEHAPRGVMTTHGDGVYKSTDAGKTWEHLGLEKTRHVSRIVLHPDNDDVAYVAAQGALYGPTEERGIYVTTDGGHTWKKTLFVDENTGASHLVMDPSNPRILYATMWDYQRYPWQVRSGGPGSGLYKSTDGGGHWKRLTKGLPDGLGKMSVSVSADNSDKIYLLAESDSDKEQGGLFVSADAGAGFSRVSKDHRLVQRAWYYIEVFADPDDENTVYVLNSPVLKSIDGGKTFERVKGRTHGDMHDLWINPDNSRNMILSNDGGPAITFNGGKTWSTQMNLPTGQFYRINVDNDYPYHIYAGQQDNSSAKINSRTGKFTPSAGGESAFLAFDPDNPRYVLGGSYQGTIGILDDVTGQYRKIMAAPIQYLARDARDLKYRFNWNAPIIHSQHEKGTFYHGGNVLLKTSDWGKTWTEISPDLTRDEDAKQGRGGAPYTNEAAGAENYGTLSYVAESPRTAGTIWTGSDDGLVQLTRDGGKSWKNVTPMNLEECLVNAIEVSPHEAGTAFIATTRYKFNDLRPGLYKTTNYGKSWARIDTGIPDGAFTRVVRQDPVDPDLLFAGTEAGIYLSTDGGGSWEKFQRNLPVAPIQDLMIAHGDLIAATSGRAFWILEDFELLRQKRAPADEMAVYTPAPAVRGQESVNLYYQLPEDVAEPLTLTVADVKGEVLRTFSSASDPNFQEYPGGPDADPKLPTKTGLNRFEWNGRAATLTGAPKAYIEGSYRGHLLPPGDYTLELTDGEGQRYQTTATIEAYPDLEGDTPEAYRNQAVFLAKVADRVNDIHAKVNRLQATKTRLENLTGDLDNPNLRETANQLITDIRTWDAALIQRKSQAYDDVINFPNGLTADYLFLRGQADSNHPHLTEPMKNRLRELDALWAPLERRYQALSARIARLEGELKGSNAKLLRRR